MIGIIAAVSPEWVIGVDGKIPWHYPADLARFKALTMGSTVIMGRLTWESIPARFRPLPGRANVVIASRDIDGAQCVRSIEDALKVERRGGMAWFIGGARAYAEALQHADVVELTYVPDRIESPGAVRFPVEALAEMVEPLWWGGKIEVFEEDSRLRRQTFVRRSWEPLDGGGMPFHEQLRLMRPGVVVTASWVFDRRGKR